ncbi:MAG: leucine-rich repeat domain-containing protein, partial [Bacteroidales bacterium]|nr:leucine-rich repeat domain-containing protein [Bacteroidales bacterium]
YTSTSDGLLLNAAGNTLVYYPCGRSEFTLTDASVLYISDYAAYGNTNFTSVTIPQQIQKIGGNAFAGCSNIATLKFASEGNPDAASLEICSMAFYNCKALTTLSLPENLTVIGAYAFGGCTRLSHVEFDSYANADLDYADYAFATSSGTFYLTSLSIGANAPVVDIASIFGYNLTDIEIADGSNYMRTDDGLILDAAGTRVLYCFADCAGSITLPGTVTELGDNVFRGRGLTSISIPVSVTKIGANTFYNCKSLMTVTFAESEAYELVIGEAAFYGCTALASITIPSGCTEIGDRAFYGCTSLSTVTLNDGLETLGDYAFCNCASLSTVVLPSTITSIGSEEYGMYNVFAGCVSLTTISINGSGSTFKIENGIIYGLSKNKLWAEGGDNDGVSEYVETTVYLATSAATGEVAIPSTVESIMYRAFYGNSGVTKISFAGNTAAEGLTMGAEAFANCTGLTEFDLPEGLTEISSGLFSGCTNLATVKVPTTVTRIENNAFSDTKLSSIEFTKVEEGETAQSLELAEGTSSTNFVFYGTNLTSVELPERLTSVPAYAFYGLTTLTSVFIPATVTSIGKNAFTKCTNLTTVTFADGSELKSIGRGAFYSDTSLATITLPDSVEEIEAGSSAGNTTEGTYLKDDTAGAFSHCTALTSINIPASLKVISQNTFTKCTALATVTVPGGSALTEIDDYAFLDDYSLTGLNLSNGTEIERIGQNAFDCSEAFSNMLGGGSGTVCVLTSVTWPECCKLKTIDNYAFYCSGLTSVTIPSSVERIGDHAFENCNNMSTYSYVLGTVTFCEEDGGKSNLQYIGKAAFAMSVVTSFSLPETYEELVLAEGAFENLGGGNYGTTTTALTISSTVTSLTGVFGTQTYNAISSVSVAEGSIFTIETLTNGAILVLSGGETSAGSGDGPYTLCCAFKVQPTMDLSYATTGININVIGEDAFRSDGTMTKITIPYTVTYIDSGAFYSCTKLTTVTFEALPEGYSTDQYALTFAEGGSSVTSGNTISVFRGCSKLTTVSLPERLVSIPAYTFYGCTASGFTTLAVPDTVTRIGSNAFGDKTSTSSSTNDSPLTSITFGNDSKLTTIDGSAFKGCSKLTQITLPAGVTSLTGGNEFYLCTALEAVTFLANSVTISGETTFYYCTALTSIDMEGFTSLPAGTFQNCTSLASVAIPYTVTSIGAGAFQSCTNLTTVTFEDVPDGAARDDYTLTMEDGGSSSGVFYGCSSLATVILPGSVARIGNYAFSGCTSLTEIVIPASVEVIGSGA